MPLICCVPECRGNYRNGLKVSVFGFPKDETLVAKWVAAIQREDFHPSKFSRVCELHFESSQIIREASAYDPRTGRTLTAPLVIPRLRKDAVPTLFMPLSGTFSRSKSNPNRLVTRKKKNQPKEKTEDEETKTTDGSELAKLLQTDSGTESQTVAEPSIVIKQEPVEPVNEPPPPLIIKDILCAEDLASSSNSSSSAISSPPFPETPPPIADPDSTNVDETQATDVSNKPLRKRKVDDVKPDTDDTTLKATRAKFRGHTKSPSKRKRLHPSAGTSKKSAGLSILPTRDAEDETREMFHSLVNDSENNPSFGSRTGENPGDLFDVFAGFIAERLREMNWDNCAFALRAILNIVFKAGQAPHDNEEDSDVSDPSSPSTPSHEE